MIQKPYYYLTSKIDYLDQLLVREVLPRPSKNYRVFNVLFAYKEKPVTNTVHVTDEQFASGDCVLVNCPPTISHLPIDEQIWFDYQPHRFRYKMMYDVMLDNDEIIESCYPNGNAFTCFKSEQELGPKAKTLLKKQYGDIKDEQIKAIRLRKIINNPFEETDDFISNNEINIASNFKIFKDWILGDIKIKDK